MSVFNIRVYGIYLNSEKKLLLTDEFRVGQRMTKFPGGGLEFGEGTIDCLKRECMEEFSGEIKIISHFYTTDFFQKSFFHPASQVMSIYYLMDILQPVKIKISENKFDFENKEGAQSFRFISLNETREEDLTFPIDRIVVKMLKEKFC